MAFLSSLLFLPAAVCLVFGVLLFAGHPRRGGARALGLGFLLSAPVWTLIAILVGA